MKWLQTQTRRAMWRPRAEAARKQGDARFHSSVSAYRDRHFAASAAERLVCAAAFAEQGRAKSRRTRPLRVLTSKARILLSTLRALAFG